MWDALATAASFIEDRPILVRDVEQVPHRTRDGVSYTIIRSPSNTYLKLEPHQQALLALMDGTRSVKDLVLADYNLHGVLDLGRVAALVDVLRESRFLTTPPADVYRTLGERLRGGGASGSLLGRIARGFIEKEFALDGLDRWFGRLYRAGGRFFFTWPAAVLGSLLGLAGFAFFFLELGRGRYPLLRSGDSYLLGFLLLAGLELVTLTIHELGHALAVKHAGRTVHRAGGMIYFGFPAAFVDTTDIWMAPRRMRLLVSFAGPWTGMVIGGASATAAYLLPESPLGAFLFSWAFVSTTNTLLNFNPLLELDGYYLLIDLVEQTMLRARSLAFVRGPLWSRLWKREPLTPDERWLALFGIASAVCSAAFLVLALRFWELRLSPAVREIWSTGDVLPRAALIAAGGALAALAMRAVWGARLGFGRWVSLRRRWAGRRASAALHHRALAALRDAPMWRDVPEAWLLEMAQEMRDERVGAGAEVVRQGEPGDRFYLIDAGSFQVLIDGREEARLGRGDYFGERALLERVPRTATVVAQTRGRVFSLEGEQFRRRAAGDLAMKQRLDTSLDVRDALRRYPLFRKIPPAQLDLLIARFEPRTLAAGETLFRQGDVGDRFYVLTAGALDVKRGGRQIARLAPGEAVGEIALLSDTPRTATVRAVEPVELLSLSKDDFRDLLTRYCSRGRALDRMAHARVREHSAAPA
ncbi:MAG: cyclic nucleotide-binding domain-containing protein [Chloroflexota bacterium]|nr:cyclic nucleotide-binding domain-containing protein [Chloroflexota bacterium]